MTAAADAAEARTRLAGSAIDLVVLDIMMPGEDGLSLCRHIRESGDLPVILLTAKSEETDRIIGLEMGADDYVLKPFSPRELVARIKAIFRRVAAGGVRQHADGTNYAFDGWVLKTGVQLCVQPACSVSTFTSRASWSSLSVKQPDEVSSATRPVAGVAAVKAEVQVSSKPRA